jgi:hypothetical protein
MPAESNDVPRAGHRHARLVQLCAAIAFLLGFTTTAQAGSLKFAWDPSPDPTVVGYVVVYGTVPGVYPYSLDVGNQTTATVYGLAGGPIYYFAVEAYSFSGGFSVLSNVVSGTTTNLPPTIQNPGNQNSLTTNAASLSLSASDPDSDPLTYSATGLPSGLSVNPVTGSITGTLTTAGVYSVTVSVSDGNLSASQSFTWTVTLCCVPIVQNPGNQSTLVGASVSLQIVATELPPKALIYLAAGLPSGLSINSGTGLITGTPALGSAGVHPVTLIVTDGQHPTYTYFNWTVLKVTPTITWPPPAAIPYGTALSATQLDATAAVGATNVPGTFVYTPSLGAVLNAGAGQTLSVTFTPTDTANYATVTITVSITVLKVTPTMAWPAPAAIPYGTALSGTQLNATASVPGTFVYNPAPGAVLNVGAGQTLSVTFTPTDAANYTTATISIPIAVLKATPTITWPPPAAIPYGTALSATQLDATAAVGATNVPGTLVYTPSLGAVLNVGAGQTLWVTFTPTDAANYTTATVSVTIDVLDANLPPTVPALGNLSTAVGRAVSLQLVASDPDGDKDVLTYGAVGLPPGVLVDGVTGLITGTPSSAGTYTVTAIAIDGSLSSSQTFTWMVFSQDATARISFIQANAAAPKNVSTVVTVPYPAAQTAGDLSVVVVGWNDSTAAVQSVTDSSGNVYALAVGPTTQPGVGTQAIYYAANIVAAPVNGNVVTIRFTAPALQPDVRIVEYAGIELVDVVDVSAAAQGSGTTGNSGAVLTTTRNDLLLAASLVQQPATTGAGTAYTARLITGGGGDILEDRSVTAVGSYVATATMAPSSAWIMQTVAFRDTNDAPVLTNPGTQTSVAGTTSVLRLSASDPDGDLLTYSATGLPAGLTVDTAGVISGTLTLASTGTYSVTATVTDDATVDRMSTSKTFTWTVTPPLPTVVTDFNGDGKADLVWRQTQTGDVSVWFMDGVAVKQEPVVSSGVPLAWQIVGIGDLDGDGKADLVWRQSQTGDVAVWLMDGATVKQAPLVAAGVPLAWQIVGVGDLNGDGKADLVWRNSQTGDVAVWLMNGAAVTQAPVVASGVPLAWKIVGIGDLDGDGKADLVWRHSQTGDVAVWLMNGATVKQGPIVSAGVPLSWQIVGVGDLDGDGKADLVWRDSQTGDVSVWLMNGTTVKQTAVVAAVPLSWQIVKVEDVDGDGKADLVWRQTQTGDVAVWLMDGVTVKQSPVVAAGVPLPWQIQR